MRRKFVDLLRSPYMKRHELPSITVYTLGTVISASVLGAFTGLSLGTLGSIFIIGVVWCCYIGWLFRHRVYGRASVVSDLSFDTSPIIAVGAVCMFAAWCVGVPYRNDLVSWGFAGAVALAILGTTLLFRGFSDGPVYGWNT